MLMFHLLKSHPLWVRGLKYWETIKAKAGELVAPFMGAWIEIVETIKGISELCQSHPLWVRGLKWLLFDLLLIADYVAPFMGAWIEIPASVSSGSSQDVAPFMGAWIEMSIS